MAVLSEEQTMLRDMVREWADNESPVTAFRKLRGAAPAERFDRDAWSKLAEMGLAGIVIPEEFGGSDFGYLSLGLVLEQLGRNLAASPLAASAAAASAIVLGGSNAAKAQYLPQIASDTAKLASRQMIQLHGGIGMTDEHDAGFYIKRSAVLEAMWGNAAYHRERFARLNGY